MAICSAKYIEGLENRLGRMESLLRLSGLLTEDDIGKTDLAELEKQLASRSGVDGKRASKSIHRTASVARPSSPDSLNRDESTQESGLASPQSGRSSPEAEKRSEGEVEALSDLMCSLVTNNSGETRYFGMSTMASERRTISSGW